MKHRGSRNGSVCGPCRSRKVKCNGKRPACTQCVRRGLWCSYELQLAWVEEGPKVIAPSKIQVNLNRVEEWMFLNTMLRDLTLSTTSKGVTQQDPEEDYHTRSTEPLNPRSTPTDASNPPEALEDPLGSELEYDSWNCIPLLSRPPLSNPTLSDSARYLLDYFHKYVGPQCYLHAGHNPYIRLILPVALASPSGSLLPALLGASANQLRLLGDTRFDKEVWKYRAKALRTLRTEIHEIFRSDGEARPEGEQHLGTMLMLCFTEVRIGVCTPTPLFSGLC
jgi:hypothetical protein